MILGPWGESRKSSPFIVDFTSVMTESTTEIHELLSWPLPFCAMVYLRPVTTVIWSWVPSRASARTKTS